MDGLTDEEYLWEPGGNCRTIRQREDGDYVWDGPAPIGELGGPFAEDTRRAVVLHILDELVHHGAEAALLRDLYRNRPIRAS